MPSECQDHRNRFNLKENSPSCRTYFVLRYFSVAPPGLLSDHVIFALGSGDTMGLVN